MKQLGMVGLAAAAAGTAALLLFSYQEKTRLSERNQALREEARRLTEIEAPRRPLSPLSLQPRLNSSLPAEQWQELLRLRGEIGVLHQQKIEAGRLSADNARLRLNWVEQLCSGKKLSRAQLEPYLKAKQRSAESLLAASQLTGDLALLREAMKGPPDPRVALTACFAFKADATPEEQRGRLEAFKKSAPENPLANFLSARAYFQSGRTQEAVEELIAASGKSGFQDYYAELAGAAEEAYQTAGLSSLEAAVLAGGQPLPHLAELKGLGESLGELAQRYRQAGDSTSALAAVQIGVALGRQLTEPAPRSTMIGELVGLKIEQSILQTLDPASPYDASGRSVRNRLDELASERAACQKLVKDAGDPLRDPSNPLLATYYDRIRSSGEAEALRWWIGQKQ